jgi:hypothetical protein
MRRMVTTVSAQAAREKDRKMPTKTMSARSPERRASPGGSVSARRTSTANGKIRNGPNHRIEATAVLRDQTGEEARAESEECGHGVVDRLRGEILGLRGGEDPTGNEEKHQDDKRADRARHRKADKHPERDQESEKEFIWCGLEEHESAEEDDKPQKTIGNVLCRSPGGSRDRSGNEGQNAFSVFSSRNGVSMRM